MCRLKIARKINLKICCHIAFFKYNIAIPQMRSSNMLCFFYATPKLRSVILNIKILDSIRIQREVSSPITQCAIHHTHQTKLLTFLLLDFCSLPLPRRLCRYYLNLNTVFKKQINKQKNVKISSLIKNRYCNEPIMGSRVQSPALPQILNVDQVWSTQPREENWVAT